MTAVSATPARAFLEGKRQNDESLKLGAVTTPSGAKIVSKKSIIDIIGSAEGMKVIQRALTNAAKENKEAGVTTASHVNGRTVISQGKPALKKVRDKAPEIRKPYSRAA